MARTTAYYSSLTTEYLANDPWGARRKLAWNGELEGNDYQPSKTARGFTDHEHLDAVSLIHMNGRVYDPTIGRFLSPDPLIQAPNNTQSYNRYSYAWNNPLSLTDPTGYEIEEIKVIGHQVGGGFSANVSSGVGSSGAGAGGGFGAVGDSMPGDNADLANTIMAAKHRAAEKKSRRDGQHRLYNSESGEYEVVNEMRKQMKVAYRNGQISNSQKKRALNSKGAQQGDWQLRLASNDDGVGDAVLDAAKDKIVDKAFEKLAPAKINILRGFYKSATGATGKAENAANAGHNLLRATINNGLRDVETYRILNTSPTGRGYYTDRIVPWGRVDWRGFDGGGQPIDVLGNFLNHGADRR